MIAARRAAEPEKPQLNIGFIPLTDCATLVAARELGLFARHGLDVTLSRESTWSSIRDKVAVGVLDAAHMLAPMSLAATLGIDPIARPMVTAMSLGLNGNAITVSNEMHSRMHEADPQAMQSRTTCARALRAVIESNRRAGCQPLTFATVFPVSSHNYQLRYWMAFGGVDPDRDVRLVIVPPPQMVDALAAGQIDGYCVGEPWNEMAVARKLGHVLLTGYELWNNSPEKVLGVTADWAEQHPRTHLALIAALIEAARWVDQPEHRLDVAKMLSEPQYVGAPLEVMKMSMTGTFQYDANSLPQRVPDFNVFYRYAATFPWRSHAIWFMTQMARWGQIDARQPMRHVAEQVYRPRIYRAAAAMLGIECPMANLKTEGTHDALYTLATGRGELTMGPDRLIDASRFDPTEPMKYLDRAIRRRSGPAVSSTSV